MRKHHPASLAIPPRQSSINLRRSCYNVAVNADRFFNTWYCINEIMGDGHDAVYLDNQEAYGAGVVLDTVEECG